MATKKEDVSNKQLEDIMLDSAPEGPMLKLLKDGMTSITKGAPVPHLMGVLVIDGKPRSVQYHAVQEDGSNIPLVLEMWRKPKFTRALQPLVDAGQKVEFFVAILGKVDSQVEGTFFLLSEVSERFWGPLRKKKDDTPKEEPAPAPKKSPAKKQTASKKQTAKKPTAKKSSTNGNGAGAARKNAQPEAKKQTARKRSSSKPPAKTAPRKRTPRKR
jgi:hypothetical protein